MSAPRKSVFLAFVLWSVTTRAADSYFGGTGDTNNHWVGYMASLGADSVTWTAYTLDPARPGRIKIAPATFNRTGSNTWTAVFDEFLRRGKAGVYGLAQHELQISIKPGRQAIRVHDGREAFDLLRASREDLKVIKSGRIPNEQGGANGRQVSSSDTNGTSAAAASRRPP